MFSAILALFAAFTPTSGVVWTQNHGFSIGAETNFAYSGDALDFTQNIPYSIGGLWVFGGNINFNMNGQSGRDTVLLRIAIEGDPAGGDAGGGPGSVLILNKALYVIGTQAVSEIQPFAIQLDQNYLPVPPDGSPYKLHITSNAAGSTWPAHMEIAMNGMWR